MGSPSKNLCVILEQQRDEYSDEFAKLKGSGIDFVFINSADDALASIQELSPNFMIVGSDLGDYEGIEFLAIVMGKFKNFTAPIVVLPEKEDGLPPMVHSRSGVDAKSSVEGITFDGIAKLAIECSQNDSGILKAVSKPPEAPKKANGILDDISEAIETPVKVSEAAPTFSAPENSGKAKWLIAAAIAVIVLGTGGYFLLSGSEEKEADSDSNKVASITPESQVERDTGPAENATQEVEKTAPVEVESSVDSDREQPAEDTERADETESQDDGEVAEEIILPIAFSVGEDDPIISDKDAMNDLVKSLSEQPDAKIIITGHASAEGGAISNYNLAISRAESAMKLLVKRGIAVERFELKSIGANAPIASNESEDGRMKNRRVSIQIVP